MEWFNPFEGSNAGGGGGEGRPGKDGRGITSILFKASTSGNTPGIAGATDTYEITYTDNTTSVFAVKNGENGSQGQAGTTPLLREGLTAIEVSYNNGNSWLELIPLEDITGPQGESADLPVASASTLGGVKIGSGISIDSSGTISVTGGGGSSLAEDISYDNLNSGLVGDNVQDAIDEVALDIESKANTSDIKNGVLTIKKNNVAVGTFSANSSTNEEINIVVPVGAADVSALPSSTKYGSSINVSINNSTYVMTTTLKDQDGNTLGTAQQIDLPLETMVVGGSYNNSTKKVVLTLKNGETVEFSVADLVDGLQAELTFDSTPTENSINPVTSGGVYSVEAAHSELIKTNSDAIGETVSLGAKNLLNVLDAQKYRTGQDTDFPITTASVTFSENDGVLTTSGTASSTLTFRAPVYLPIGTYVVSGCPAGGSDAKYRIDLRELATNTIIGSERDYGNGFEISILEARTVDWCIRVQNGTDMSGLIFKPMICPAAIYEINPSFTSYAPSNATIYSQIGNLSFVKCTQNEYDAMASHDSNTVYIISG